MSAAKIQRPLHVAAWVVALAVLAAGLWAGERIVLNRPPREAVRRVIARHLRDLDSAPVSVTWKVAGAGAGAARVDYVAQVQAAEDLYVPTDVPSGSRAFIAGRLGADLTAWMEAQQKPLAAADQAAIGPPPPDPLAINVVRIGTRAGTPFEIRGNLQAARSEHGWTFKADPGEEFTPPAPIGAARAQLPAGTLVEGDPADEAALAKALSEVRVYAEKVAAAPPADLPVEARLAVKLAQSGVGEDAIISQLQTDTAPVPLSAAEIIYLARAGVPQNVIRALIDGSGPKPVLASAGMVVVMVPARTRWMGTGIELRAGQEVDLSATGMVQYGPRKPRVSPRGNTAESPDFRGIRVEAPNLTPESLIGRIGSGEPFEIGSALHLVAPAGGPLYLSINDNYFRDNSGAWTVRIDLGARPGPGG